MISYETYWLLRREKPDQILVEDETSDAMAFLNEKVRLFPDCHNLMGDGKRVILSPETKKGFLNLSRFAVLLPEIPQLRCRNARDDADGLQRGVLVADDLKEQES